MSSQPATTPKAVFLSYAREDSDPARRIADALRAAGVEVWFDQSELRGGDAWDAKIRKQIKECALFMPVISANTEARSEGYFRLEWKLADDRTHLMAKGTPFILPVCIDGTKDWDAIVPDAFTTVQWTRLPGGETTIPFVQHLCELLEQRSRAETAPGFLPRGPRPSAPRSRRRWPLALALATMVIIGALFYFGFWRGARTATPVTADKSIAVLPFA